MSRVIIAFCAIVILAGAFPAHAHEAVNLAATWLAIATSMVSPSQQMAIVLAIVLIVLVGVSR